jgi:hypothetical protein
MTRRIPVPNVLPIPYVERALIPPAKLRDYVLAKDHPDGGPKARWFEQHLAIRQQDWEYLRHEILKNIQTCRVRAIAGKRWIEGDRHCFGLELEVHVPILGRNGQSAEILTGWMLDGLLIPRFTTARPLD